MILIGLEIVPLPNKSYFSEKHCYKLFIVDISISINISLCNQFIRFLLRQDVSNILHHQWQLCGGYKTIALLVKYSKCLSDLLLYLRIMKFSTDNRKKLIKYEFKITNRVISQTNSLKFISPSPSWSITLTISYRINKFFIVWI